MAASLCVHAVLFTPLLWGGSHPQQRMPNTQGAGASQQVTRAMDSMLVVFMDDDATAIHDRSQEDDATNNHFLLPQAPLLPVGRPHVAAADPALTDNVDDRATTEASGDQTGHALMFGRYMGQISARVERAWLRPRSAPVDGSFSCRVQITQDQHGNVQEVALQKCTNDWKWQMSLVRAINTASPLPAPPDPAVFSNLLTVEFDSDPYSPGGSDQGFEPLAARQAAAATAPEVAQGAQASATVRKRMRPDGSWDLTIVGPAHN